MVMWQRASATHATRHPCLLLLPSPIAREPQVGQQACGPAPEHRRPPEPHQNNRQPPEVPALTRLVREALPGGQLGVLAHHPQAPHFLAQPLPVGDVPVAEVEVEGGRVDGQAQHCGVAWQMRRLAGLQGGCRCTETAGARRKGPHACRVPSQPGFVLHAASRIAACCLLHPRP